MGIKRFAVVCVAWAITGLGVVSAEDDAAPAQSGRRVGIMEDLDNLGKSLFGGSRERTDRPMTLRRPAPATPVKRPASDATAPTGAAAPRAGSVINPPTGSTASRAAAVPARSTSEPSDLVPIPDRSLSSRLATETAATPNVETASDSAVNRPLHQRMSTFRNSAMNEADSRPREAAPSLPPAPKVARKAEPTEEAQPTPAVRPTPKETPDPRPIIAAPGSLSSPSERVSPSPAPPAETRGEPASRSRMVESLAPAPQPAASRPTKSATPAPAARENLLITRKSPVLGVETLGSRKITVGKETTYQLTLSNSGDVAAEEVVVYVSLPAWADVQGADASVGAAQVGPPAEATRPLVWKVGQLPAGGREHLTLRLVPRESRAFDLAVRWDYQPAAAQAMIEVQEPKVAMHLEGPREVLYGRKELFALKVANVGTGDAENVVITLLPVGTGDNQPASHRMGLLKAGEEKTIEVELTARQTGELSIQVETRADNGVQAALAEKVLVRRAGLQLDVQGPQVQFVNAVGAYRVRVVNPGNAPARQLRLTATLPNGAKYLSGIEGARADTSGTRVQWAVDALQPGAEQVFVLRCNLGAAGQSRIEVNAVAQDELTAVGSATTRVDAMADLRLEVKDPQGPIALGDEAVYELKIRNRGTKAAEGVEVLVFFSNGIEPVAVEGGMHKIQPGQVVFQPIPMVGPGAEMAFKVRAKADAAGAHVFRAEVHCKPLGTRLVSEETTHFYQDGPGATLPQVAAEPRPIGTAPTQTAEPYAPPAPATASPMPSPLKR